MACCRTGACLAHQPERGDVVVFRPAPEPDRDFIKRLIGLPGDTIQVIDGVLHINGEPVQRQYVGTIAFQDGQSGIDRTHAALSRERCRTG